MGNLAIAKTRHAEELRILQDRRDSVEHNLETGGVSAGGMQRPKAVTDSLRSYLKELDGQIAELSSLDDSALMEKYTPELPEDLKEALRNGVNFIDTLNRGPMYH